MRLIAILPMVLFLCVMTSVGMRLLGLARRTRELPEASIGGGLLLIGLIGQPLAAAGRVPANVGTAFGEACFVAGVTVAHVGLALLFVFTWSVFRRHELWGLWALALACLLLASSAAGLSWAGTGETDLQKILPRTRPFALLSVALAGLAFLWSGIESGHYYLLLRRRMTLGLAEPIVTNRFFLWAVVGYATAVMCIGLAGCLAMGMAILVDPVPVVGLAVMGTCAGVAFYLSFLPPKPYLAAIRRRSRA